MDGMTDSFASMTTQPVKGAGEKGALGATKGLAKGTVELATKVPSGMYPLFAFCSRRLISYLIYTAGMGLVAYSFHGIAKRIEAAVRSKSRRDVVNAWLIDGYRQTQRMQLSDAERNEILRKFDRLYYSLDA